MQKLDSKTVNDALGVLSRVLTCAPEWGVIELAPRFAKLKAQQPEMEFFEFDDLDQLVAGARKAGPEVLAFVLLGADAGLRRGEIIALETTDADHQRGRLTIARSDWCGEIGSPKGGRTRRVPMTKRLAEALSAIRHLREAILTVLVSTARDLSLFEERYGRGCVHGRWSDPSFRVSRTWIGASCERQLARNPRPQPGAKLPWADTACEIVEGRRANGSAPAASRGVPALPSRR